MNDSIVHVPKKSGESRIVIDHLLITKVSYKETKGAYALGEIIVPCGGGPPMHAHEALETFYILEGEFTFEVLKEGAVEKIVAQLGDTVHIPANVPHGFKNTGSRNGRMLGLVQPGAMAEFFEKIGKPYRGEKLVAKKPSLWQLLKIGVLANRYGVRFVKVPK